MDKLGGKNEVEQFSFKYFNDYICCTNLAVFVLEQSFLTNVYIQGHTHMNEN